MDYSFYYVLSECTYGCSKEMDLRISVLPTQSYKSTGSDTMHITIPLVSNHTKTDAIKYAHATTDLGEQMSVSETNFGDSFQVGSGLYIIPVTLTVAYPLSPDREYHLTSLTCSVNGQDKTLPIDIRYYREKPYDLPFLMGQFVVDNAASTVTYEMKNISDKSITITSVDCGPEILIKDRYLIGNTKMRIDGAITVKPQESIKQEIEFARDTKFLSEITLQHHTSNLDGADRFSTFSFAFPGTSDGTLAEAAVQ